MIESKICRNGVDLLQNIGLKPIIDESLKIAFNDPLGISTDLCKIQNRCATQGYHSDNEATLYIDGKSMGPLENLKVQDVKALAEPSPFGLGSKTVYDENVRKALEIKGDRINLDIPRISEFWRMAPMGYNITPKLYKLAIYEKDGFFAEHADTLHGDNHIGTLVMCLPVPHEGGAFILSDNENELRIPFDEMIQKNNGIPWVAFYTDIKHKVEVVKSGVRMTLQYDLIVEKTDETETELKEKFRNYNAYDGGADSYYFKDYNQEVIQAIKDKLAKVFSKEKIPSQEEEKKSDKDNNIGIGKRDRPDDNEALQSEFTKQPKLTGGDSEKEEEDDEEEEKEEEEEMEEEEEEDTILKRIKREYAKPDGVALMLKRRYGAASLSVDMLKGSDSALYHALKDDFVIEAKIIILEQNSDEANEYTEQPIQVVAISEIGEVKEQYPSDEENERGENNKYIPRKVKSEDNRYKKKYNQDDSGKGQKNKLKKVCLVTGHTPQEIAQIVQKRYIELTGNEASPAVYSYMHAALFIYPKESL